MASVDMTAAAAAIVALGHPVEGWVSVVLGVGLGVGLAFYGVRLAWRAFRSIG